MGFYIPQDAILRSHCREDFKTYNLFVHRQLWGYKVEEDLRLGYANKKS
jgi:hypothetical protein